MRRPQHSGQGVGAAIEGFAAFAWFGWGQADPPSWLSVLLSIGSVLGLGVAVAGIVLARRARGGVNPLAEPAAFRRYLVIFWGEVVGLAAVAVLLGVSGHTRWIPVAVCAGVGIHFLPLAPVVRQHGLIYAGSALVIVAGCALVAGLADWTVPGTVTGAGAGLVLLVSGVLTLLGVGVDPSAVSANGVADGTAHRTAGS